ncbi:cyclin domain-containing protein [Ditylenchus destructor]|uniref:Cyclin domain-containing protein n=1 Tax=Ditylenchus destructor TaxID=166010 RepID=A0AAD4NI87_9BILA|nr:cyclin domain-containing protein [Ditylenchus destructor]
MGNNSCCVKRGQEANKKKTVTPVPPTKTVNGREISVNFLPHISEREIADDEDQDPSTHPSVRPTFVERSKSEMRLKDSRRSFYVLDYNNINAPCTLKKSNSCSTIYLDDSTITQPHLKNSIVCISLAIYYHIVNRKNRSHERLMEIFEERLHPISREPITMESLTKDPEHRQIYRFVRTLFYSAQLTAECAIITLVYVERLLTYAEIDLCPSNWRRIVLGAIMLASKVWDDQAVWNVDYCQILPDTNLQVDDMNELERQFLECLEFNINVPSSVYAKYYYDLRQLAIANDLQLALQPLYKERAQRLEALSRNFEEKIAPVTLGMTRSMSVERLKEHRSPVIIP